MPRQNSTRFAILGLLHLYPMSGYDIKSMTAHSLSHFWQENFGAIYPELRRLTELGLITRDELPSHGRKDRKAYAITDEGKKVFQNWLPKNHDRIRIRHELLLKIFFGAMSGPGSMLELIEEEKTRAEAELEELAKIETHLQDGPDEEAFLDEHRPWWRLTVEYGKRYYSGILDWCEYAAGATTDIEKEKSK